MNVRLSRQFEEFLNSLAVSSSPFFQQVLEALRQGDIESGALVMAARESDLLALRELGNALGNLLQECAQYQLLLDELDKSIVVSLRLHTEMQAKMSSINSSLIALLAKCRGVNEAYAGKHAQHGTAASEASIVLKHLAATPIASSPPSIKEEELPITFSVTCLSPFKVEIGNKPAKLCPNRNGQAILRYLIAQPEHCVTADTFMDILWPEDEAEVSLRKLQVTMSILRRSLNSASESAPKDGYILYRQHAYQLNPAIPLHIDVDDFLSLYAAGNRLTAESAIEYFERACDIYVRPFLMEDIYADWSFLRREQLRQIHVQMCTILAEHYLAAHNYNKAAHWASVIIGENRCDEVAYQILMRAYALEGRRSEALRQFQRCQQVLLAELSMQPVAETVALYQAIAAGDLTSLS